MRPCANTFSKNMHRFYLRPENWESATLDAEESHHCLNVLRLSDGDRITVFDGAGREGQAVIASTTGSQAKLKISSTATTPPPPCAITLAQAVPKGKNMDLIVQKAVELGAETELAAEADDSLAEEKRLPDERSETAAAGIGSLGAGSAAGRGKNESGVCPAGTRITSGRPDDGA
jgi:16S rRNA U1498 N3-methylase RsmE